MSVYGIIGMSLGVIAFLFLMLIGVYVLWSIACAKALIYAGYSNTWMAWIPIAREWALADAASAGSETLDMFGAQVPKILFELSGLLFLIVIVPFIGAILFLPGTIILRGTIYSNLYATCEDVDISQTRVLGYLSGAFPIIALIKFFMYK